MKLELFLIVALVGSVYTASSFYSDKLSAELRQSIAEDALAESIEDKESTKTSYNNAIAQIDKIRKEAEREKCNLKTLTGGSFTIKL